MVKIKNFVKQSKRKTEVIDRLKRMVKDSFTESGAAARDAIYALIDEMENSEVEFDEISFKEAILAALSDMTEETIPEPVLDSIRNTIAKKLAEVKNFANGGGKVELPVKVKNSIAAAILRNSADDNGETVKEVINQILVKNGITGFEFCDMADFTVATKWEENNELFAMLKRVQFSKIFYSEQEMISKEILAKGWTKENDFDKVIQEINVTPKTITTQYIYKRQEMAFEDLDDMENEGQLSQFLTWLLNELDSMIINSILYAILIGDTTNDPANRITSFESIGAKNVTDIFTKVIPTTTPGVVTAADVRALCDSVLNPDGKQKVLVISTQMLTFLSEFTYGAGGTTLYRTKEEVSSQMGVDMIYVTDILLASNGVHAICFIPDEYWYKEKKVISAEWIVYERNRKNYMKERNIGGIIRGLMSSAVLKTVPN